MIAGSLVGLVLAGTLLWNFRSGKISITDIGKTSALALPVASQDEDMVKAVISEGLEDFFNSTWIPVGEITLMSPFLSGWNNDFKAKRFNAKYLEHLKRLQTKGLVTVIERPRGIGSNTQAVTVIPTELAKKESDASVSARLASQGFEGLLIIPLASCEVLQIIRDTPYQSPKLSQTEEYRLVLGTYRRTSNKFGRSLDPGWTGGDFKYRVVLQFNPFTKRYVYWLGDWGYIEKDGWETDVVEEK
ncbi:MAG: hypothetical protein ACRD98_11165 [Nitrososphaera sp.]